MEKGKDENENSNGRKKKARKAAEKEKDTQFLDKDALDDDLIDLEKNPHDEDRGIVDSTHPENEEWHVREFQNENRPQ